MSSRPSQEETLRYGPYALQTITVAPVPNGPSNGFWVILIHGGAWRDPTQTATNFLNPVLSVLQQSTSSYYNAALQHVAAFASISYRLSAHPDHPQDIEKTFVHEYRNARHPEHIRDVQDALKLLQKTYRFKGRYILAGHSCGATLAFQCVMDKFQLLNEGEDNDVVHPIAILGTEGIYDLKLLRDTHKDISAYQEFIEGAFGSEETAWDFVSPALKDSSGYSSVKYGWRGGRLAVLAHSAEDNLVDASQGQEMKTALALWMLAQDGRRARSLSLKGEHDDPWQKGEELARAIVFTIDELQKIPQLIEQHGL